FYFIPSAMTGFIVSVFPFRNRVSSTEAFEGLELGEGKPSRPVLRGPGGRKAARLLGSYQLAGRISTDNRLCLPIQFHLHGNSRNRTDPGLVNALDNEEVGLFAAV